MKTLVLVREGIPLLMSDHEEVQENVMGGWHWE